MPSQVQVGDISIDVIRKDIKNVYLTVHPPTGRVRISAPTRMSMDTVRVFAVSKLEWIKKHQDKLERQEREMPREYLERESHYVWGTRYLLTVVEEDLPASVELQHHHLVLKVRPGSGWKRREEVLEAWYRQQLREALSPLIARWEGVLGVKVERLFVRKMRTRWGSCNHKRRTVRFNTDLAKKPRECLEYVVVHEMAHLLEPSHNGRFTALMDRLMPQWRFQREQLNQLPVRHEDWEY